MSEKKKRGKWEGEGRKVEKLKEDAVFPST
jgi:hypothetical protein